MDRNDTILMALLFLVAFFAWNQPIKDNKLPFGEGDSAWHYASGEYMAGIDRTITHYPMYIEYWYYNATPALGIGALQYPPAMHVNYAMMLIAGGDRIVPYFLFKALAGFLGIFSVYFLLRNLFGQIPAFLASLGIAFSLRPIMLTLFGQQPTLTPYLYLPLILYAYYRFVNLAYEGKDGTAYLVVASLLTSCQVLFHLQAVSLTLSVLAIYSLLVLASRRRLPVMQKQFKAVLLAILAAAIVCLPFWSLYAAWSTTELNPGINNLGRIFTWSVTYKDVAGGYPLEYVNYSPVYGPLVSTGLLPPFPVLLPFVLLGAFILLLRRGERDLLILSWILGMYINFHLDVFMGVNLFAREGRMLAAEPLLFFTLMAIGVCYLPSLVGLAKPARPLATLAVGALFTILLIFAVAMPSYDFLKEAYGGISRITPAQYRLTQWMQENLPQDTAVIDYGTITYSKVRWMLALSHTHVVNRPGGSGSPWGYERFAILDYSDLALLGPQYQEQVGQMQGLEAALKANATLLYDKDMIRLYKLQ